MREGSGTGDRPEELQSGSARRLSQSDSEDVFSLAPCAACYSQKLNAIHRRGGSSSSSEYCPSGSEKGSSEEEESEEEESTSGGSSSSGDDAAEPPHGHLPSRRPESEGRGDGERQEAEETSQKLRARPPRLLPSSLLPRPSPQALSTFRMQLTPSSHNSDALCAVNAERGGVQNPQQPPLPFQWRPTRSPYPPWSASQPFPLAPMFPPPLLHASVVGPRERLHALVPQPCCSCCRVYHHDLYCGFHGGTQTPGGAELQRPQTSLNSWNS